MTTEHSVPSTNALIRGTVGTMSQDKQRLLRDLIRSYSSCLVAYSGGVDSVLLAYVAWQELGVKSLAVIADSPSLARSELAEAEEISREFGFPLRTVKTTEFEDINYTSNPENRCYFCKKELFSYMEPIAREEGFRVIAYGENASDLGDFRPGSRAATEFRVRAPLKEAGFTKDDIRGLSRELGLPTHEKPQMACLSSRVPHGEEVTPEKLSMIEKAELIVRKAGFFDVRVRHHELKKGALARIELGPEELAVGFDAGRFADLAREIKRMGYLHVTLDLIGYRRGGADQPGSPGSGPVPSRQIADNFSEKMG